jgi:hypothetical protein
VRRKKKRGTKMEKEKFELKKVIPKMLDGIIAFISPAFDAKYIPFWLSLSGIGLVSLAFITVYDLFRNHIGVGFLTASMDAFASVGILSVLLIAVIATKNNALKGMGYLLMAGWMLLTFALVSLGAMLGNNKNLAVPEALVDLGKAVAGLLPALALVPVLTMAIANANKNEFPTASAAAGHYFGFVLKLVMIGASIASNVYFGLSRKIEPIVAVLCGVLLESLFVWALFKLIDATQRKDRFDVIVWSIMLVVTGFFLAFVGIETVSSLSRIQIPAIVAMQETGALIYVSAIGISFALTIIAQLTTSLIDWLPSYEGIKSSAKSLGASVANIKMPTIKMPTRNALAAPAAVSFAADSVQTATISANDLPK